MSSSRLDASGARFDPGLDANPDSQRKNDHIRLALGQQQAAKRNAFDDIRFVHHSLRAVDQASVDTATSVCGAEWELPFYINAMTGGSAQAGDINAQLATAAAATGLAMATGSQHAALRRPELVPTFTTVREHDPDGFVFANVGPTVSPGQAVQAVRMLGADALQIHVNPVQEAVMAEGDRDYGAWPGRIQAIVAACPVPVVVKEVGFGLSRPTVELLASLGVGTVDVSGRGGTDFAVIENGRRADHAYWYMDSWGLSTILALLTATHPVPVPAIALLASGGVRSPLDVVKALALGARAVGVSGHFLATLTGQGVGGLIDEIHNWSSQVRALMSLLGAHTMADLKNTDMLVTGSTAEEATLLGVDLPALAHRHG
ncbi:type 2 isopentenyl-diphosphate Delta-isomerase [Bifidobacterium xylocopae]|uniref:Isopentenyl-diphosphate delta-isomerase n=1 Tax=Bifidobacterium xylocopae TaxID=2493119 RepID=A0A366KB31_9BIFI|nr:type 2 isopentenyl-diphosphate Delta-isomerase [Bifidobacterium xylocopae]RBP98935.1 type 2 isopentenyl-diphosphate Delta-isomerase [Bifidobacterium xylocopae]